MADLDGICDVGVASIDLTSIKFKPKILVERNPRFELNSATSQYKNAVVHR